MIPYGLRVLFLVAGLFAGMAFTAGCRASVANGSTAVADVSAPALTAQDAGDERSQKAFERVERGAERFVNRELNRTTALYFTCFGIYLLVAIIFFIYWRWMRRDLPMLSVGLLSLVMAVHTAAVSGSLAYLFPNAIDADTSVLIETVSYLLVNGLIAFMLWAFFTEAFYPAGSDWAHILNSIIAGVAALSSLFFAVTALFADDATSGLILSISRWVTVALMIVVAALAIQALEQRRGKGVVTTIGLGLLIVGSIHDVLFAGAGDAGRPYLITFAFLGFVLLQSYVVMRRSAESTQIARMSSKRLRREVEARTTELRAASVAAQAANMAKTEFVTAVTHELRTPLSSMLGYVELLRDELGDQLSEQQEEFFDTLETSGERLLNLVNNLLDLARIESGRIELNLEPVSVDEIVENVRNELYPLAKEKEIYLRVEIEAEGSQVQADAQWLGLVLTNLVSNAIKFTEEGGVTIRVMRSMMGKKKAVAIKVIDTGPGISSEFMPHLFERFSREEHARSGASTGTGLGLTIARELLHRMHGEIFVESKIGVGSSFSVLLPVPEND